MPNKKKTYSEIDDIREDLDSLRNNVVELTKHIKKDTNRNSKLAYETALERLEELKTNGLTQVKNVEKHVKARPSQSLAMAFAAGLAASFLLKRR